MKLQIFNLLLEAFDHRGEFVGVLDGHGVLVLELEDLGHDVQGLPVLVGFL